jgi:hypothetical protein
LEKLASSKLFLNVFTRLSGTISNFFSNDNSYLFLSSLITGKTNEVASLLYNNNLLPVSLIATLAVVEKKSWEYPLGIQEINKKRTTDFFNITNRKINES